MTKVFPLFLLAGGAAIALGGGKKKRGPKEAGSGEVNINISLEDVSDPQIIGDVTEGTYHADYKIMREAGGYKIYIHVPAAGTLDGWTDLHGERHNIVFETPEDAHAFMRRFEDGELMIGPTGAVL